MPRPPAAPPPARGSGAFADVARILPQNHRSLGASRVGPSPCTAAAPTAVGAALVLTVHSDGVTGLIGPDRPVSPGRRRFRGGERPGRPRRRCVRSSVGPFTVHSTSPFRIPPARASSSARASPRSSIASSSRRFRSRTKVRWTFAGSGLVGGFSPYDHVPRVGARDSEALLAPRSGRVGLLRRRRRPAGPPAPVGGHQSGAGEAERRRQLQVIRGLAQPAGGPSTSVTWWPLWLRRCVRRGRRWRVSSRRRERGGRRGWAGSWRAAGERHGPPVHGDLGSIR